MTTLSHSASLSNTDSATDPTNVPPPLKGDRKNYVSPMAKKFIAAREHPGDRTYLDYRPAPWKPIHYFFYDSLMDEQQLTEVLHLDSPPVLRPAFLTGYSIKMFGPRPALIDGPVRVGNIVNGMVYEVQREDHEKMLMRFETDAYQSEWCGIRPEDGGKLIYGSTFLWAGDPDLLSEGSFDLGAWKKARPAST